MAQGNASGENVMGQTVRDGGGNKKNQGNDELIAKNSASVGPAAMPKTEGEYCVGPKGQETK